MHGHSMRTSIVPPPRPDVFPLHRPIEFFPFRLASSLFIRILSRTLSILRLHHGAFWDSSAPISVLSDTVCTSRFFWLVFD